MQNLVVPQSQATMAQVHSLVNTRKLPKGLEDVLSELKELEITGPALCRYNGPFFCLIPHTRQGERPLSGQDSPDKVVSLLALVCPFLWPSLNTELERRGRDCLDVPQMCFYFFLEHN